jgi:hypothetical protein
MPHLPLWLVFVPLGAFAMVVVLAWMAHRSRLAASANERDVQLALLSKFSTAEEMTQFLTTPEGRRLIDQLASPKGFDARRAIIDYITGGLVTLFVGGAMMALARLGMGFMAIPAFICLAVGAALLITAAVTWPLAKRLGLIASSSSLHS